MIELTRTDKRAIKLTVDGTGLNELLAAFQQALKTSRSAVRLQLDPRLITGLRGPTIELNVDVEMSSTRTPALMKQDSRVLWVLDREDFESGVELLERALKRGHFFPAEFLRLRAGKSRTLDWIYAELNGPAAGINE